MRTVTLFLTTAATLWGCSSNVEPVDVAVPVEERIENIVGAIRPALVIAGDLVQTQTLAERMKHHDVPGVSIAVVHDGRLEWARGYGLSDIEREKAVMPDTLFQAGSVSKPVAALSALRLAQAGQIDLAEDVNTKLTSWQVSPNEWTKIRPVTVRNLLSHTAGTTVHGFPGYARDEGRPSTVDVLDGNGNTDPVRVDLEPASEWRYSGGGYTVMQLLVSDVAGEPFADVMRATVLNPIGMRSSTYEQPLPESLHERAAAGYRADGTKVEGGWHVYPEMAAAGLWTTPSDLARYIIAIQRIRAGREGGVLINVREVILAVAGEYGWPGFEPVEKTVVEMDADALAVFAGRYAIEGFGVLELSVEGRGLAAVLPDDQRGTLLPESETIFFDPDDGQMITFVEEGGQVTGFRAGGATATKLD